MSPNATTTGLAGAARDRGDDDVTPAVPPPGGEATPQAETCRNCGALRLGHYCVDCGQEFEHHAHAARHFLHDLTHELTHFDASFLGTVKPLLLRPGQLTADWIAGRRAGRMRPLQVFMVVNLLFFLVGPSFGLFAYPLRADAQGRLFHGDPRDAIASAKMARDHLTTEQFIERFTEHEAHWRKGLVFLMVPPFALVVWLLERRRTRWYMDHLAFALHFYAFYLLGIIGVAVALFVVIKLVARATGLVFHGFGDELLVPGIFAVYWVYLTLAVRRAYGAATVRAVWQGLVLTATSIALIPLYAVAVMTATLLAM
jgi:hypothetical protein